LSDIDFDYKDYKIIKEDPIIAWHFSDVKDKIDLTYRVKKKIDPDCLKQIKGLPIARLIEEDEKKGTWRIKPLIFPC
jgi:hypothetical protein